MLLMVIASEWIIYVVSVLCQRVWAQSSAQPHSSYRPNCLTSAWHRDQLPCPALPPSATNTNWRSFCRGNSKLPPIALPLNPLPSANTAWLLTTRRHNVGDEAAQNEPFKRGLSCCPIPSRSRGKEPKFTHWLGCGRSPPAKSD